VIGSTIDPPQEATLLDFRTGRQGRPELRAQSIPAVPDPALACAGHPAMPSPSLAECRSILAGAAARCPKAFPPQPRGPVTHPQTPEELASLQNGRALPLLECLGVDPHGTTPLSDPEVFTRLARADRLTAVCLSHLASVVQGHKSSGWILETAREIGLVPETMIGSRSIVVPTLPPPLPAATKIPLRESTPAGDNR
jgi:hypothetical protein